jgi:hypothetical protein
MSAPTMRFGRIGSGARVVTSSVSGPAACAATTPRSSLPITVARPASETSQPITAAAAEASNGLPFA